MYMVSADELLIYEFEMRGNSVLFLRFWKRGPKRGRSGRHQYKVEKCLVAPTNEEIKEAMKQHPACIPMHPLDFQIMNNYII